jgi:hypothetical protein
MATNWQVAEDRRGNELTAGAQVRSIGGGADDDTGTVRRLSADGETCEVGWDSGVCTWIECDQLVLR